MVNNESLTALKWFGIEADAAGNNGIRYNDVVRWIYDALYKMNIECDIIYSESTDIEKYKAVILPAMYVADEKLQPYFYTAGNPHRFFLPHCCQPGKEGWLEPG